MNLENIQEQISKLEGSDESKKAFVKLIDIKSAHDMEKLVSAIDKLDHKLETSIGSLNSKLETSIGSLKEINTTSIGSLRSEMQGSKNNIRWTITIAIAIATAFLSGVIALVNFLMKN